MPIKKNIPENFGISPNDDDQRQFGKHTAL